ncbi:hypothetical protein FPOAC1_006367 [Fusarium poae]|jgi:thioredoxin 1|uniref:hypothetical protein n=1 Tax=Fusarium poae TaxID=36050 RepID=UPI001CE7C8CF|nr:hypothetical protein FPOAC1_006367 [Fusarium poae]KAG8673064.1 hypothetical protein FPOAC1_006367 [Fusarium poae]
MPVVEIKDMARFKELLKSHPTVIIDAGATWCAPCKAISPYFEKYSELGEYDSDKVVFAKFDTDEVPDLAQELGIRSIPAFFHFQDGELYEKVAGANPGALGKLVEQATQKASA